MPTMQLPPRARWLLDRPDGRAWADGLDETIDHLREEWGLTIGDPFEDSHVSFVLRVTQGDGGDAVLKLQWPHPDCAHEADALARWDGDGAVRLLRHDRGRHALLLERCAPGDHVSSLEPEAALGVLAALLPRLWVDPGDAGLGHRTNGRVEHRRGQRPRAPRGDGHVARRARLTSGGPYRLAAGGWRWAKVTARPERGCSLVPWCSLECTPACQAGGRGFKSRRDRLQPLG